MTDAVADTTPSPEPFRLKAVPIIIAFALGLGIIILSAATIEFSKLFVHLPERPSMPWLAETYSECVELVYALIGIWVMKFFYPGSYGLRLPAGRSYVGWAILWGVFFGVVMTGVDYWPQLMTHSAPNKFTYGLNPPNIAGWLGFEGVVVGPCEETLFRGLLVTYLAMAMPGKISVRGLSMNGAGIVIAVMFALAHVGNFFIRPFPLALGQMVYAFVLGVFYAYWYEKSKSLIAPIVGHNMGNVIETGFIFAMVAMWR